MSTHTARNGKPLQSPQVQPLRRFAIFDRDKPCTEHQVYYSGTMPCTGALRCRICGTYWDADTGEHIG